MEETQLAPRESDGHSEVEVARAVDELLERYLHLLDEQQKLQEAIGRQFAQGFFSLARANHSCPPGRRFGEDYYDDRMKATRHVEITMTDSAQRVKASLMDLSSPTFKTVTIETKPDSSSDKDTPDEDTLDEEKEEQDKPSDELEPQTKKKVKTKTSNPLHWFGILVPPPLRNAQEAFSSAVAGPIPALAGVVSEMREVERKVEGLRQVLGVSDTS